MKRILIALIFSILGACTTLPQPKHAPAKVVQQAKTFHVEQYELLLIQYRSPTVVDAIDAVGPADKIYSCVRAAAAGVAQEPSFDKGHAMYVPTCLPIVISGPIPHGAVAVQPVATNAHVLFWTSESLDYDASGAFLKGNQPQGPFKTSAECASQSALDIKNAYAAGKVAQTDTLVTYCVPILAYGQQADGSSQVKFKLMPYMHPCPWFPSPGAGPCQITAALSRRMS